MLATRSQDLTRRRQERQRQERLHKEFEAKPYLLKQWGENPATLTSDIVDESVDALRAVEIQDMVKAIMATRAQSENQVCG